MLENRNDRTREELVTVSIYFDDLVDWSSLWETTTKNFHIDVCFLFDSSGLDSTATFFNNPNGTNRRVFRKAMLYQDQYFSTICYSKGWNRFGDVLTEFKISILIKVEIISQGNVRWVSEQEIYRNVLGSIQWEKWRCEIYQTKISLLDMSLTILISPKRYTDTLLNIKKEPGSYLIDLNPDILTKHLYSY